MLRHVCSPAVAIGSQSGFLALTTIKLPIAKGEAPKVTKETDAYLKRSYLALLAIASVSGNRFDSNSNW
jgi:hypothetical protein